MQNSPNALYAEFLKNLSFPAFTEMQEQVIEKSASSENLLVLAPTGSGKNAFIFNTGNQQAQ